jgi:hypothetical protein
MRFSQLVLCSLLAAGLGPGAAAAQVMTMGLRGGMSIADSRVALDGSAVNTDRRKSFDVGGFIGLAFSRSLTVQLEGHVTGRGFRLTNQEASELTPGVNTLYFDIPLVAVFSLAVGDNPILTPRLFAGPLLALRMTCTPIGTEAMPATGECGLDVGKQVDFGMSLGGGLKIGGGLGGLLLDVSYNRGLVNLSRSSDINADIKNQNLVFSVGFIVPIV